MGSDWIPPTGNEMRALPFRAYSILLHDSHRANASSGDDFSDWVGVWLL